MRRVQALLLVSVVTAGLFGDPAAATSRPPSRPPTVLIIGHGFGHGRGMGQWGARAMAHSGARWPVIVSRYYRGVSVGSRPSGENIRVLLGRAGSFVLTSDSRFELSFGNSRPFTASLKGRSFYRIGRSSGGLIVSSSGDPRGPWRALATGNAPVRARGDGLIQAVRGDGSAHAYRGVLEVRPYARASAELINDVSLESYLFGVVPREMPAVWPIAALQAQAVAARTYAVRVKTVARSRGRAYDICATTACQVYGGAAWIVRIGERPISLENDRTNAAVKSTAGRVILYGGQPILAEYSSSTGGYTADGGVPYLAAVPDPSDAASPYHTWRVETTPARIAAGWPELGRVESVGVSRTAHGRALSVLLSGTRGSREISAGAFAAALRLRSTWFGIRMTGSSYFFKRNLGYGTTDIAVSHLQQRLRAEGFYPTRGPITTYFGTITRAAVRRYQKAHHIPTTGFVGPRTRAAVNAGSR